MPPLEPPGPTQPLPSGAGALSLGEWLLSPTVGFSTFYDSNIHGSAANPLPGPGFHFNPGIRADYDSGLYDTQLYASIDSEVYPSLNYENNTFNRQAGMLERYSPLPDLSFIVQGNYVHNTNAAAIVNSIPTPISPSLSPTPSAAQVVASQTIVVNPNDTYTASATIFKQLNRAYVQLGGSVVGTYYENNPTQNFNSESYNGGGGFWFSPLFYAFGDGVQSYTDPELGAGSNYFRARAGIGSSQIGLFQGSVYYGQQGSEVNSGGKAGGDIYGGIIYFYPTVVWSMTFGVDRMRNVSDIPAAAATQALVGLPFSAVPVTPNGSAETTTISFRSNYTLTAQTSAYVVLGDTLIDMIHGSSGVDTTRFVGLGVRHQATDHLSFSLDYSYSFFTSETPNGDFSHTVITLGAVYNF